jgi:hypothetical protein
VLAEASVSGELAAVERAPLAGAVPRKEPIEPIDDAPPVRPSTPGTFVGPPPPPPGRRTPTQPPVPLTPTPPPGRRTPTPPLLPVTPVPVAPESPLAIPPERRSRSHEPTLLVRPLDGHDELPQGRFVYRSTRRSKAMIMVILAALSVVAAGTIIAVDRLVLEPSREERGRAVQVASVAVIPIDAAPAPAIAAAGPDAADHEIEMEAPPDADVAPTPSPDAGVVPVDAGTRAVRSHHRPAVAPSTSPSPSPPVAPAPPPASPPPVEDGCDEVSCVMDRYARPCCQRYKPADSGARPSAGPPADLDKAMVRAGIEKVKPKVIACGESFAAKGTVKVTLAVGGDGLVHDASVVEAPDPGLGECVAAAMRKAQFAKTTNGGSFTYPFVF